MWFGYNQLDFIFDLNGYLFTKLYYISNYEGESNMEEILKKEYLLNITYQNHTNSIF